MLAPVYGWFTEGFDTHDLKEAKALLDALNAFRNGLLVGSRRLRIGRERRIGDGALQEIERLLERAVVLLVGRNIGLTVLYEPAAGVCRR